MLNIRSNPLPLHGTEERVSAMDNTKKLSALRSEILRKLGRMHMSDEAFADYAGIGQNTIKNVLKGHNCRVDTLIKICDALEIELTFKREGKNE